MLRYTSLFSLVCVLALAFVGLARSQDTLSVQAHGDTVAILDTHAWFLCCPEFVLNVTVNQDTISITPVVISGDNCNMPSFGNIGVSLVGLAPQSYYVNWYTLFPGGATSKSFDLDSVSAPLPQFQITNESIWEWPDWTLCAHLAFTLDGSAGPHGTISPAGSTFVPRDSSQMYAVTPEPGYCIDSIFVDGVYFGNSPLDTIKDVILPHTIHAAFAHLPALSVSPDLNAGWNLVSFPFIDTTGVRTQFFPTSTTKAFSYSNGYFSTDTLTVGRGYWLKIAAATTNTMDAIPLLVDTVPIASGWNLIGSAASAIAINSITSIPPGLVTSDFYGYERGYVKSDTIQPGRGYWVKADSAGTLILSSVSKAARKTGKIRIVPTAEMPPSPPALYGDAIRAALPMVYSLSQNYPNPFNPTTTINYQLPKESFVHLAIFNVLGQDVVTLVNETEQAGYKSITFDASALASGVYFYSITAGAFSDVHKMILLK